MPKAICYCLTKSNCETMAKELQAVGIEADYVHSGRPNVVREELVKDFKNQIEQVICATEGENLIILNNTS